LNNLILFGGTYDPIHLGHMNTAIAIQKQLHFDRFIFLPCKIPVLNKGIPHASTRDRLSMIELALHNQQAAYHFEIDPREITRDAPSYTVLTLREYRSEYGMNLPITLLMGIDTFSQLPEWFEWEQLTQLANLLVIDRPGINQPIISDCLNTLLEAHECTHGRALLTTSHGLIVRMNAGNYDISSTQVRQSLYQKDNLSTQLLDPAINQYIQQHHLYSNK